MSQDEHYAYSRMTDTWYRIHDYDDQGDGHIIADGKTEVDVSDVPEEQRRRIELRHGLEKTETAGPEDKL